MARKKPTSNVSSLIEAGHRSVVLIEMIRLADTGRCMACGWPLVSSESRGCVTGNCSFRPQPHEDSYARWHERTQILALARKPFPVQ
jgi:hypothetical protein